MAGSQAISPVALSDPGRALANMRLFEEVIGQVSRQRKIPKNIKRPDQLKAYYPSRNVSDGGVSTPEAFQWHLPPDHPLEPAPDPPEKTGHPNPLAPLAKLGDARERLENLQRVRNFTKETVFARLEETPQGELFLSPKGSPSPSVELKDRITGETIWHSPAKEARQLLLQGLPLKGLSLNQRI